MPTQQGSLVIADISGYTGFVAGTELEHSRDILSELIEAITSGFKGQLSLEQLEGDAVFAVGGSGRALLTTLQEAFTRFHRRLRDIMAVTSCPCQACVNAGALGLKFVAHWGEFSRQRVGGGNQLFGSAVIVVHRLLKNTVPSREYILATATLLDQWPAESKGNFLGQPQEYPDVGRVDAAYLDLAPLRRRAWTYERTAVAPSEATLRLSATFAAPLRKVWELVTDAKARTRWMSVEKVEFQNGARGGLLGAEYHCHHGAGAPVVFRVISVTEPTEMTQVCPFPSAGDIYSTIRLTEDGPGRTRLDFAYDWDRAKGIKGVITGIAMRQFLRRNQRKQFQRMHAMLTETSPRPADEAAKAQPRT